MAEASEKPTTLGDMVPLLIQDIESIFKHGSGALGLPSGFRDLDSMTGGVQKGFIAIGSRPGLGKTAMAISMALAMARSGRKGAYIMPSMNGYLFSLRMLALVSGIPILKLRTGLLKPSDMPSLLAAAEEMSSLPVFLEDGEEGIDEIVDTLRSLASRHAIEWAFIDSLDSVRIQDEAASADECAREASRKLKAASVELGIPLIALFQLDGERTDSPPSLRGGGALADALKRDADEVILLGRRKVEKQDEAWKLGAQFVIAKSKFGPVGSVDMLFDAKLLRFCDLGSM